VGQALRHVVQGREQAFVARTEVRRPLQLRDCRKPYRRRAAYERRHGCAQTRIQQSLEPRYNRKAIFHLPVSGVNQCSDLEEELLAFPKSPNDDTSDSAAYQVEIAQPPAGGRLDVDVAGTRRRLTQNQSR
jgi:hypothetical protein